MSTEQFANKAASNLASSIGSGDTTLSVVSASAFPASGNFRILIDSEIILVTAVSGTTFTVTRGAESTSAASHASGAAVTHILTAGGLNAALAAATPVAGAVATPFADLQDHSLLWYIGGSSTSIGSASFGWASVNSSGSTVAVVAPSAGSKLNGTRKTKFATSSASLALGIYENGSLYAWRGDAANRGGFKFVTRFAIISSGTSSVWVHHHGLCNAGSPAFVDYTTNTSVARVMLVQSYTASSGGIPAATNWKISECDGTTNTLTDTGLPIVHGNLVELILYCAPNGTIQWTVNDITAGTTASGSCTTSPPTTTTFLAPAVHSGIVSGGSATCEIDIALIYCELFG